LKASRTQGYVRPPPPLISGFSQLFRDLLKLK
jgi:hypothetical protein